MKGIYLFSGYAKHPNYDIIYNDVDKKCNAQLKCSAEDINLSKYDFIIASPPCNYWSKANINYKTSEYALKTKHLLLWALEVLPKLNKPFIIENVRNVPRFRINGVFDLCAKSGTMIQTVGRHTYFTNILCDLRCIQTKDYKGNGIRLRKQSSILGGDNVHRVIESWLQVISN